MLPKVHVYIFTKKQLDFQFFKLFVQFSNKIQLSSLSDSTELIRLSGFTG